MTLEERLATAEIQAAQLRELQVRSVHAANEARAALVKLEGQSALLKDLLEAT